MRTHSILLIVVLTFATACGSTAQQISQKSDNTIVIDATGEVLAPADRIYFQINLNRYHEEASTAFEEHKRLESYLTNLLQEMNISHENINANPISISPRRHSNQQGFETRQAVSIELDDTDRFESMQVTLIENGFDNFSARFATSRAESAQDEALQNAIEQARTKASLIASASDMKLGSVKQIDYTSSSGITLRGAAQMSVESFDGSLLQFQKSIPVRETIRMIFYLE
jgi:uncharacterized protein